MDTSCRLDSDNVTTLVFWIKIKRRPAKLWCSAGSGQAGIHLSTTTQRETGCKMVIRLVDNLGPHNLTFCAQRRSISGPAPLLDGLHSGLLAAYACIQVLVLMNLGRTSTKWPGPLPPRPFWFLWGISSLTFFPQKIKKKSLTWWQADLECWFRRCPGWNNTVK